MIAYADTSALVKLFLSEPGRTWVSDVLDTADVVVTAEIAYPEMRAALAAAVRGRRISPAEAHVARDDLEQLWDRVVTLSLDASLARSAGDVAEHYGLRGYDAVPLASALRCGASLFVAADLRLLDAARTAGLAVVQPA